MLDVGAVGCASVSLALGISVVTVNLCLYGTLSQNKLMREKNESLSVEACICTHVTFYIC